MTNILDNDTLIACYRQGMTDKAIAQHVGCPTKTVTSRRQSLGLPSLYRKHTKQRVTPERLDLQYANGLERYYDEKAELKHKEHEARALMIREVKMRLGTKYVASRDLKKLFDSPRNDPPIVNSIDKRES